MKGSIEHQRLKNSLNMRLFDFYEECLSPYCKKKIPKNQGYCNQKCLDDAQAYDATKDELGL